MKKISAQHQWTLGLSLIAYLFAGTVSTLVSVYLPVIVNDLKGYRVPEQELGTLGAFVNAFFLYGWMAGGILMGLLGDRFGRKKILALSTALYGAATLLIVFVHDWRLMMFYRILAGLGVGGTLVLSTVMISETWPEKSRAVIQGILSVSFPVGIVATGGLNILFEIWRRAFWLGLIPILVATLMILFLKEPATWNRSASQGTKLKALLHPPVRYNLISGILIFGSVLIGLWGLFSWMPTWVQSILPEGYAGTRERGLTMMLLGIGGITGGLFSGFLVRVLGARKTLSLAFTGLTAVSLILFLTNPRFSEIIYPETVLLALFFGISQGSLSHYIPELFPSPIRAAATGLCFNIGRFFTATAVFFVGSLVTLFGGFGNALLVFSITFVIAFLAVYFTRAEPERQLPIPQTVP
ncbi:MAG TPA: MFS transporter [Saprospiraceae bacterium]|nr:MFS transporter [Saprospiraceae bacterium]HNT21306.1 MFS transporter [Saprospiraceae bacterium]